MGANYFLGEVCRYKFEVNYILSSLNYKKKYDNYNNNADTNPITLPCLIARAGNNKLGKLP